MARRIFRFAVTIPAGTALATPLTTPLTMPAVIVRRVTVRVPPGMGGLVGWYLGSSGTRIVPENAGAWMVMDDETFDTDLQGMITSGAWGLTGYNTGSYDHTLHVTFYCDPPQRTGAADVTQFLGSVTIGGGPVIPPVTDTQAAGYAAALTNALAALDAHFVLGLGIVPVPVPAVGTAAAIGYADGRTDAAVAVGGVTPAEGSGPGATDAGYAAGRGNATAAVETALHVPLTIAVVARPDPGTTERARYDTAKSAALAALAVFQA